MAVVFEKYEGLGNDFVVVEARDVAFWTAERVRTLCSRHRGVGADGVLLVLPPRASNHRASMKVINADGSVPEMCGNGLRCVVRFLSKHPGESESFVIETDAGPKHCTHFEDGDVEIQMGRPIVGEPFSVTIEGATYRVVPVDVGNPHGVVFAKDGARLARTLGPTLERSAEFPRGANIEFVDVTGSESLRVDVWERGAGITQACGTGAVAAAAAAHGQGDLPLDRGARVTLPGGELCVRLDEKGEAWMRGPARHVFSGKYSDAL